MKYWTCDYFQDITSRSPGSRIRVRSTFMYVHDQFPRSFCGSKTNLIIKKRGSASRAVPAHAGAMLDQKHSYGLFGHAPSRFANWMGQSSRSRPRTLKLPYCKKRYVLRRKKLLVWLQSLKVSPHQLLNDEEPASPDSIGRRSQLTSLPPRAN